MSELGDGASRELHISTRDFQSEGVLVPAAVRDSGPGLSPITVGGLFELSF